MPIIATDESDFMPPAKRRGRPARLSAETVVLAALALLDDCPADDFTMTRVAQAVGTTTMALYRYFPSRDALLDALANHVFAQFEMERVPAGRPWQDTLFAWQCALKSHFERHQTLTRLMAWNGHLSGAWLRVQMPVIEALHAAGFHGRLLTNAVTWFLTDTVGLLTIGSADLLLSFDGRGTKGPGFRSLNVIDSLDCLDARQRELVLEMLPHSREFDTDAMIEFGFKNLIRGIETLLNGADLPSKFVRAQPADACVGAPVEANLPPRRDVGASD